MTVKKRKYNYKKYSLILDLDVADEKAMSEYLEKKRGKRNNFNDQLKKALKMLINSVPEEG